MRAIRIASSVLVGVCALGVPAIAQDNSDQPPPAHIGFVDGGATLIREDVTEPATAGAPLVDGDQVRTTSGRVEVLFPDGSALDVDEHTSFELQAPGLLRLTAGRVLLIVAGASDPASAARFQLDTPVASARTNGPGEYRVSFLDGPSGLQVELAVVRGSGTLETERGSTPLRAGERSVAWDNAAPSYPQSFNSARFDAFDRWAALRRDERLGSRSAQYLPPDLQMYGGTLDRSGDWEYDAPYGQVWYPRVGPDWRPYYDGYWSSVPQYGWTWIGVDVWSWPTHHYGRWGFARERWFWIPDRHYAPAWVSWGGAPGYVSWCPLGFNNRPVFALSISNRSTWAGWTVLPRDHFGGRIRNVNRYAVSPRSIPVNTPFITQNSAPVAPPRAVPRRMVGGSPEVASGDRRQTSVAGQQSPGAGGRPTPGEDRTPRAVSRQPGVGSARADRVQSERTRVDGTENLPSPPPSDLRDRGGVRTRQPDATTGQIPRSTDTVIYSNRGARRADRVQGDPTSGEGRTPQAVSRQPGAGSPRADRAQSERPRADDTENLPSPPPSDLRDRGGVRTRRPDATTEQIPRPNDTLIYSNRGARQRPASPPVASPSTIPEPGIPASPERQRYGIANRRPSQAPAAQAPPAPSTPPDPASIAPRSRRPSASPGYERPTAPPPAAAAPPTPSTREDRPSPPPQRERQETRPRGGDAQPSSSSTPPPERQQGGHGSRRPR